MQPRIHGICTIGDTQFGVQCCMLQSGRYSSLRCSVRDLCDRHCKFLQHTARTFFILYDATTVASDPVAGDDVTTAPFLLQYPPHQGAGYRLKFQLSTSHCQQIANCITVQVGASCLTHPLASLLACTLAPSRCLLSRLWCCPA